MQFLGEVGIRRIHFAPKYGVYYYIFTVTYESGYQGSTGTNGIVEVSRKNAMYHDSLYGPGAAARARGSLSERVSPTPHSLNYTLPAFNHASSIASRSRFTQSSGRKIAPGDSNTALVQISFRSLKVSRGIEF
jgi:hypothetical protein